MTTFQREIRYLTTEELTRLRRYAEARALHAKESGAKEDKLRAANALAKVFKASQGRNRGRPTPFLSSKLAGQLLG